MTASRGVLRWEADVSPADWIAERLHPFARDTGSIAPPGFEAYARVFHPITDRSGVSRTWAHVATRNHRIPHPEMQLHLITRPAGEAESDQEYDTTWGSLPRSQCEALVRVLRRHTSTPDLGWLCLWEGFGVDDGGVRERVLLPARNYLLASAPIDAVSRSVFDEPWDQSPNLWWPDDRAWVVVTEIDFAWTYVGGTSNAIADVLAAPDVEAMVAELTDKPFHDSDLLNAALD